MLRTIAMLMVLFTAAMTVATVRQLNGSVDGGPPMGAMCVMVPVVALLIAAGKIWAMSNRDHPHDGG